MFPDRRIEVGGTISIRDGAPPQSLEAMDRYSPSERFLRRDRRHRPGELYNYEEMRSEIAKNHWRARCERNVVGCRELYRDFLRYLITVAENCLSPE